jgi:hypothetical protein
MAWLGIYLESNTAMWNVISIFAIASERKPPPAQATKRWSDILGYPKDNV